MLAADQLAYSPPHRVVDFCRPNFLQRNPLRSGHLRGRSDRVISSSKSEPEIEVLVCRFATAGVGRNGMDVDIEESAELLGLFEVLHAGLFADLAASSLLEAPVLGFEVSPWLEPQSQAPVKDEQQAAAAGVEDESRCREMSGPETTARAGVFCSAEEIEHPYPIPFLSRVG